jgi:hypothetical protein
VIIRFFVLFGWLLSTAGTLASEVRVVPTEGAVIAVFGTAYGVYVQTERGTFQLETCTSVVGVCLRPGVIRGLLKQPPQPSLPDGLMAERRSGDIRRAWYIEPTERYAHGILGDAIEAGALAAIDHNGNPHVFKLPPDQVFEDLTPRLVDLDDDGSTEIVTIRSSQTGGAAIAIYGLRSGQLVELGASSENGRPNRWLNIAGVVGTEQGLVLYGVRTPHIGGRLFSLTYDGKTVTERNDIASDLSNHVIGSRELRLSEVVQRDGRVELVLPSQDRKRLRFPLSDRADIALPGPVNKAIVAFSDLLITATEDGKLLAVRF